ncbi:MAG: zf-HC2 domain-containing protein [Bryobacteraceae bacterium]|jgi:hypothetical protein
MRLGSNRHADDDLLERYSMGRLAGPELERFEEHLLICPQCQDNLASADAYVGGIRSAAAEFEQQSTVAGRPQSRRLFNLPRPAGVLGLAALGLFLAAGIEWRLLHRSSAPPALVVLKATRGTENPSNAATPAGKPFILILDLTDLRPLSGYRLEIVDGAGHRVFESAAAPANNKLQTTVAQGLPAGMYYVRVYAPGADLLREYGMQVR